MKYLVVDYDNTTNTAACGMTESGARPDLAQMMYDYLTSVKKLTRPEIEALWPKVVADDVAVALPDYVDGHGIFLMPLLHPFVEGSAGTLLVQYFPEYFQPMH